MGDVMETKVKRKIKESGLKQEYVAAQAQISRSALSLIVNGKSVPTLPVAIRIARILNDTVENLWGDLAD